MAGRLLLTADAAGGVWVHAIDLARGLTAQGVSILLVAIGPRPDAAQMAEALAIERLDLRCREDIPLDWLARDEAELRAGGAALAAIADQEGVALVQLNSPAHAAGQRFRTPLVAVCHSCVGTWWDAVRGGALPADLAWRSAAMREGLLNARVVVTPSHAFADALRRHYALFAAPVVVHNGRAPCAATPAAGAPHCFAITAGRFWDAGKNIGAMDRVAARLPFPLYAAGAWRGPDGSRASADHLRPLGQLDGTLLRGWLAHAPIFISLAFYEPFGLAVLEAAQAGCPLVLSDIPSFRELWDGAALFVDPSDDAGAAAAVARVAADPETWSRLGASARLRASRFTVQAMVHGMRTVQAMLLAERHVAT